MRYVPAEQGVVNQTKGAVFETVPAVHEPHPAASEKILIISDCSMRYLQRR